MVRVVIPITNSDGLTPRLAAELVEEANKYECDVKLFAGDDSCDLKSIMNVFGTIVNIGDEVIIVAEGIDELKAQQGFEQLKTLFKF